MKSSTRLIRQNKELKDRQRMKDLRISYVGLLPLEQWPKHLFITFQQIRRIRSYDLLTFCNNALAKSKHEITWDYETTNRAKTIAATCRTLLRDEVSEMEWRLRLEELVLARFRSEIECPNPSCQNKLWRSEIDAVVESPGAIAVNLEHRRERRKPCQCENKLGPSSLSSIGINKIFSSRSDEMLLYDPFEKPSKKFSKTSSTRTRRPDRIIGFQDTGSLARRLDPIAHRLQDEAGIKTIRETTECTVLNHKSGLLLFPFLVIEAKSETGEGFSACARQTAFPIWKMLKIQEELQSKSGENLEYGGPLLWYIAYRGEEWRLSGCYTVKKQGSVYYEILDLWSGRLSDENEALQMLLIIDYIFDWARNIYRPSIISQLETLATPAEETDDGVEIRLSRMLTDSDIFSLTGSQRKMEKDIDDWISSTLDLTESPQDEDLASNLKGSNLERDHEDSLIPSSSNPESATFNGSEQLVQNAFEIRSRKESTNEPNLERAHSASTKSLASGMGEDEAAELRAAITDSVFTRYQELVAQDPPTALPVPITTAIESRLSENGETDESESETARIDGTVSGRGEKAKTLRPYLVLEETASNNNLGAADPKTRTNNKESPLVLHNLPSASPWPSHVSSSPPPSLTDSTSSAPPTRADAPSPSPSIKPRTSSGPPKRPLESGDEFEVLRPRKKLKTSSGSAGIEVVIID